MTERERIVGVRARPDPDDPTQHAWSATPTGELRLIGQWRIDRLLGQGGMADVYRAFDEHDGGRPVALKLLRSSDPVLAQRLAREAMTLESFDHPNLVRLLGTGVDDGRAYLVTELVEGPTLAMRLRRGRIPPPGVSSMGAGLARALAYVHERGIVHRDLKPHNVLLGPGSRVRLADFGIARLVDNVSMTATGSTIGTTSYMAPEQLRNHDVGSPADVWSLGLVLLESLRGEQTFTGTASEVVAQRLAGPVNVPSDLPAPWRLVLGAMLEESPARRPSATEVAEMITAPAFRSGWTPEVPVEEADPGAGVAAVDADQTWAAADHADKTIVATNLVRRFRLGADERRWKLMAGGLVAAMVVLALVAWSLSSPGPAAPREPAAAASALGHHGTKPTVKSSVSAAAATLVRDDQTGMASGAIIASTGTTILSQLNNVLAALDSGLTVGVGPALGTIDATIAGGAAAGAIAPHEASVLTSDVSALAATLRVSTIATTTTTTAPPPPPPGPHHGKGGGGPGG